jgi:phosphopentomutase
VPSLFVSIVLDGVGAGAQPDASAYGDEAASTLENVCRTARPNLPNLARLGLGRILDLEGVPAVEAPLADFGRLTATSAGKDSTTGHWELAGLHLEEPFPTYPSGFPQHLIDDFLAKTNSAGVLGNVPASGTEIVTSLGRKHLETRYPILYTSADSVFQVAAHVDVIPLEDLYRMCRIARDEVCVGDHAVGRVIARPFTGSDGAFERLSADRKDYSLPPPSMPVQEALRRHGVHTVAVGKISSLFAGVGFDESYPTKANEDGIEETLRQMRRLPTPAFLWVNLVDFDQEFGHRNDPYGFAAALEAFDAAVPALLAALPGGGRLFITADHGNDPTTPGTDHTREYVPVLYVRQGDGGGRDLGVRSSFSDHAAEVASYFGVRFRSGGLAF